MGLCGLCGPLQRSATTARLLYALHMLGYSIVAHLARCHRICRMCPVGDSSKKAVTRYGWTASIGIDDRVLWCKA